MISEEKVWVAGNGEEREGFVGAPVRKRVWASWGGVERNSPGEKCRLGTRKRERECWKRVIIISFLSLSQVLSVESHFDGSLPT